LAPRRLIAPDPHFRQESECQEPVDDGFRGAALEPVRQHRNPVVALHG
jgi:hypothetical protein